MKCLRIALAIACYSLPTTQALGRCGDVAERPWCDTTLSATERSERLLGAMSLPQKIGLMSGDDLFGLVTGEPATGTVDGIADLGVPPLYLSDGPMGPREGQGTAMPAPLALGASFHPELAAEVARVISTEVRLKGNDLVHAPTVDVMRNPLAGRTFETYGEDPYLASRIAVPWVRAAQAEGVIANVKHYAMNTQEGQIGVPPLVAVVGGRSLSNAVIDERTLREIYLPPFEAAVVEGDAGSIMCAYNYVNGEPACSSPHLLQQILRGEWGFDGFVLTDYILANKETDSAVLAGLDIEMPIGQFYTPPLLLAAVTAGLISEADIDARVGAVMRTLFRFGFFDREAFPSNDSLIDIEAHAAVAREALEQGTVLLKNNGILPLGTTDLRSIALIGEGALSYYDVGGSASVQPFRFSAPLDAIRERAGPNVTVTQVGADDIEAAAALAAASDVAIVFARDSGSEGVDKTCLSLDCPRLPGLPAEQPQDDLIRAVAAANARSIVVLQTGGPVLTPWRDSIAALLEMWYPGQESGTALARLLFGDADPGGRLPLSFMEEEADTPLAGDLNRYPGVLNQVQYSEGIFIGYRWHDQMDVAPAYPFGFGLSYTRFEFSQLNLQDNGVEVTVRFTVRNVGSRRGVAVPQIYLGMPAPSPDLAQPPRQLKGFKRLALAAGEAQSVELKLLPRDMSYWDSRTGGWAIAEGCYSVMLAHSSRDITAQRSFARGEARCGDTVPTSSTSATPIVQGGGLSLATLCMILGCLMRRLLRSEHLLALGLVAGLTACGAQSQQGSAQPAAPTWPSDSSGCGSQMDEAFFADTAQLESLLASSNSFGLRSPGSTADARHIDWIIRQLQAMPGMQVAVEEYELHRWQPLAEAVDQPGRSLERSGALQVSTAAGAAIQLPVAGIVPFSKPTGPAGWSGPLVYLPGDIPITAENARGKVVIRDYPGAPVPYAVFLALAYYISPDAVELSGSLDRPYLGSGQQDIDLMDAGLAEAAGVIFAFNVPREDVAGYWDPHSGMHFRVPALHVGVDEREELLALAALEAQATLTVEAERDLANTRTIIATLPGKSPERVVLNTNHDGVTWVQENGVTGLLALADYFSRRPASCRERSLEFVFGASHLSLASEGTDRYAERLEHAYAEGDVAFAMTLEHMGTREILPEPRSDGPGEQLRFTGEGESSAWFVGESPALINATVGATVRHNLDKQTVLRGADLPGVGRLPVHCSFGGLGNLFHRRLIPTVAFISGPWSLWAPSFGASAIDFERMRRQLLAAGDIILETEPQPRSVLAGSYDAQRALRDAGLPTCPPEIRPVEAPAP